MFRQVAQRDSCLAHSAQMVGEAAAEMLLTQAARSSDHDWLAEYLTHYFHCISLGVPLPRHNVVKQFSAIAPFHDQVQRAISSDQRLVCFDHIRMLRYPSEHFYLPQHRSGAPEITRLNLAQGHFRCH